MKYSRYNIIRKYEDQIFIDICIFLNALRKPFYCHKKL